MKNKLSLSAIFLFLMGLLACTDAVQDPSSAGHRPDAGLREDISFDTPGDADDSVDVVEKPARDPDAGRPGKESSSSVAPRSSSSSSILIHIVNSSSSENDYTKENDLGFCVPEPSEISLGEEVSWKVLLNTQNEAGITFVSFAKMHFDWSLPGFEQEEISGTGKVSVSNVKYSQPGDYSASVLIVGGTSETKLTCAPLHVNGDPITGCKCAADKLTADIASKEVGSWTVSDCQSLAKIVGYEWDETLSSNGSSATYDFKEAGEVVSPKVVVKNDDNTRATVACESVKAVDSRNPEYVLKKMEHIQFSEGLHDVSIDVVDGQSALCNLFCNTTGEAEISVNGETLVRGSFYVSASLDRMYCETGEHFDLGIKGASAECSII